MWQERRALERSVPLIRGLYRSRRDYEPRSLQKSSDRCKKSSRSTRIPTTEFY